MAPVLARPALHSGLQQVHTTIWCSFLINTSCWYFTKSNVMVRLSANYSKVLGLWNSIQIESEPNIISWWVEEWYVHRIAWFLFLSFVCVFGPYIFLFVCISVHFEICNNIKAEFTYNDNQWGLYIFYQH